MLLTADEIKTIRQARLEDTDSYRVASGYDWLQFEWLVQEDVAKAQFRKDITLLITKFEGYRLNIDNTDAIIAFDVAELHRLQEEAGMKESER